MRLLEFTKLIGSLLVLIAIAVQLGCDRSTDVGSTTFSTESDGGTVLAPAVATADPSGYEFEVPVRLMAGGEYISVESPGYACPTMADVDGDGKPDLVVGQFSDGKMHFCKNIAEEGSVPEFAKAEWIETDGDPARVPGVW